MKPEEIRSLRHRLGLSVADAALEIGTNPQVWYRWERGAAEPGRMAIRAMKLLEERCQLQGKVVHG